MTPVRLNSALGGVFPLVVRETFLSAQELMALDPVTRVLYLAAIIKGARTLGAHTYDHARDITGFGLEGCIGLVPGANSLPPEQVTALAGEMFATEWVVATPRTYGSGVTDILARIRHPLLTELLMAVTAFYNGEPVIAGGEFYEFTPRQH